MTQIISPSSSQWTEPEGSPGVLIPAAAYLMDNGDGTYSITLDETTTAAFTPQPVATTMLGDVARFAFMSADGIMTVET